ncbi:hypothetical protein RND81_01G033200 [Saponaria officinalis]|uniref:S-protein homolog n=1 Tax=Saponaria officinalis TaxID=3572 RepID=A0AAW1N5G7_SAPOF
MGSNNTNIFTLLCFVAILCSLISCINGIPFLWDKWTLHVKNGIQNSPNQLYVHCKSKNDDFGEHYLSYNQEVHWKFGTSIFGKLTHFTCDLKWGDKGRSFDAFVDGVETNACDRTSSAYWFACEDGIYFSCKDETGKKRCAWDPNVECDGPY